MKERDHQKEPDVDRRIILKRISEKWAMRGRTGFIWLRIEAGSELL
jgi:hypothetical protein